MPRIRTIKPGFWEDEKVSRLPIPCRLFFIGTWNLADDLGVIRANPVLLKSAIFPYEENLRISEVQKWLEALVNARMLIPVSYKDESYYIIRTFRSHQKFDARYPSHLIPEEEANRLSGNYTPPSEPRRTPTGCPPRDRDREGDREKGKENNLTPPGDKADTAGFEKFWELYDKKVGKKEVLIKKWLKLSAKERESAMSYIPKYKLNQPDKQYRKNPESFLSLKSWNDELIPRLSSQCNFANHDNNQTYEKF